MSTQGWHYMRTIRIEGVINGLFLCSDLIYEGWLTCKRGKNNFVLKKPVQNKRDLSQPSSYVNQWGFDLRQVTIS